MSWVIEEYIRQLPAIMSSPDINDEVYNNALLIQKCIGNLDATGNLTAQEKEVLIAIVEGYNYTEISRLFGVDRQTVSKVFDKVTDRVAYVLGGEFSDASFLDRVSSVEELPESMVDRLIKRGA